jgi:hypothetical protein
MKTRSTGGWREPVRTIILCGLFLVLLALFPKSAKAPWGTGEGRPPAWRNEQVCLNGITWRYATIEAPYLRDKVVRDPTTGEPVIDPNTGKPMLEIDPKTGKPVVEPDPNGTGPPRTLKLHDVVSTPYRDDDPDVKQHPSPVLTHDNLTVPANPVWLDPKEVGIAESERIHNNFPGLFNYSTIYTLQFPHLQAANGKVRVQWRYAPNQLEPPPNWPYDENIPYAIWSIDDCYLIDLEPGEFPNHVNPRVPGDEVAVAVLTTGGFDAKRIEKETVRFGTNGRRAKVHGSMKVRDMDGDGDRDAVFRFMAGDTGINCGSSLTKLEAKLKSGKRISGADSVEPVGC